MKKVVQKENRTYKFANNHKKQIYHKLYVNKHIVSKGWSKVYSELASVYQELQDDFECVDLIDLKFYERWLNGRY